MKSRIYWSVMLVMVMGLLLGGCAKLNHTIGKNDLSPVIRPEQSVGVLKTPFVENGKAVVVELPLSDSQVGGEMYPGRTRFAGVVSNAKKEIIFAQAILAGNYPTGEFMSFVIVDVEKTSQLKGAKFLPLSSQSNVYWNNKGEAVPIDQLKFNEGTYLSDLIMKEGVSLNDRRLVEGFVSMVKTWSTYSANGVDIYSPLSEKDIQEIAKINPGYKFSEQLVLRNKAVISINPVEMIAKASITLFAASKGKTQGWDYTSELASREQMAMIIQFVGEFRLKIIQDLNQRYGGV